jgi:hypothetical protein
MEEKTFLTNDFIKEAEEELKHMGEKRALHIVKCSDCAEARLYDFMGLHAHFAFESNGGIGFVVDTADNNYHGIISISEDLSFSVQISVRYFPHEYRCYAVVYCGSNVKYIKFAEKYGRGDYDLLFEFLNILKSDFFEIRFLVRKFHHNINKIFCQTNKKFDRMQKKFESRFAKKYLFDFRDFVKEKNECEETNEEADDNEIVIDEEIPF